SRAGEIGFGCLQGERIAVYRGDMFSHNEPTGESYALKDLQLETPCTPSKMFALWNNFHEAAKKLSLTIPQTPLYFLKSANSFCPSGATICPPKSHSGRMIYEGELGIVIGKRGKDISMADASTHIFGYTCVNDVTALELLQSDPSFPQWTRAKNFDSFTPFGPVIATNLDPATLTVRTLVNGRERQNYPVSDMIFSPAQLVSLISQDVTLLPGDVISCGTSVGALPLRNGATVDVIIEGIGTLSNRYGESLGASQ
ncbi:MAG TPA: fumarylacetoacetate hydrolase family protein, partial [Steroidobacteraceae bacterium]|nr:fumarylacetoacetate hydrolase family protein [Steroidobacteraceae bacterium]